jgi:hypothetical protein
MGKNRHSVYARRLEDNSGYGIFQRLEREGNWELCLGVGSTCRKAWLCYYNWKKNNAST